MNGERALMVRKGALADTHRVHQIVPRQRQRDQLV